MNTNQKHETLKAAFFDDPLVKYIAPDSQTRKLWLHCSMGFLLEQAERSGEVTTLGENSEAVLGVYAPGKYPSSFLEFVQLAGTHITTGLLGGLSVPLVLTALRLNHTFSKLLPHTPHWHIGILGVDPTKQGQGFGTRLMEPVLQKASALGIATYLETSNPKNLIFYQRLGFHVLEEIVAIPGAPPLWRMAQGSFTAPLKSAESSRPQQFSFPLRAFENSQSHSPLFQAESDALAKPASTLAASTLSEKA